MPELAEIRIMSDYINGGLRGKKIVAAFDVKKGNIPEKVESFNGGKMTAESRGKELFLKMDDGTLISCFMGMSGSWLWTETSKWEERKFTRLRLDADDGTSLLMWGLYMGPKWKIGGFNGKRGPDPTRDFDAFRDNVMSSLKNKVFSKPICEMLLDQKYFNGIGNYLRSTILYYLDVDPFQPARDCILSNPIILDLCRDVPLKAYSLNGGQLQDWSNPFGADPEEFRKWVFYQKGYAIKDSNGRTFWFHPKWADSPHLGIGIS
jgi:endonuclease VIII-like 1